MFRTSAPGASGDPCPRACCRRERTLASGIHAAMGGIALPNEASVALHGVQRPKPATCR